MADRERWQQTAPEETVEWLREHYPEADSTPEATRMAISDARHFWTEVMAQLDATIQLDELEVSSSRQDD